MKKTFSLLLIILFVCIYAQQERSEYCKCETKGISVSNKSNTKDITLNSQYIDGNINIKIINNTTEPIYIFKSYFDSDVSNSLYLYRFDPKNNVVNISFLPLLPYLYTKYSDKVIMQNRIIEDYQTIYDFYKIQPFHEYSFNVKAMDIYKTKEFIKDFDISQLNKFQKIKKFKKRKTKNENLPDFVVKIAYYNNINTICSADAYFLDELKFNTQAKSFKILSTNLN